jgi:hypothetical protein
MKKHNSTIGLFIVAFSLIFLFISSGANAESQDDARANITSVVSLKSVTMTVQDEAGNETKREGKPLREIIMPLQKGFNAFFDFGSPARQVLGAIDTATDSQKDYRTVVGFHIPLN